MQLGRYWIRALASIGAFALAAGGAEADVVVLAAGRDTTLIENPAGALANGSGPEIFIGRNNAGANYVRRGLLYFDLGAVPRNAQIEAVRLTLYMTPSHSEPNPIRLHRLLANWGEGASVSGGGGGDDAEPGDATWLHTFYDDESWAKPGGHFVARASASREVADVGFYTWEGGEQMREDVRTWLAAPHRNFGWILLGNERVSGSVKTFASREEPDSSLRPLLEVTYHLPGQWAGLDHAVDYGGKSFALLDAWRKR